MSSNGKENRSFRLVEQYSKWKVLTNLEKTKQNKKSNFDVFAQTANAVFDFSLGWIIIIVLICGKVGETTRLREKYAVCSGYKC